MSFRLSASKLTMKVLFPWLIFVIVYLFALANMATPRGVMGNAFVMIGSFLLSVLAFRVYQGERDRPTAMIALSFAVFFGNDPILHTSSMLLEDRLLKIDPLASVYFHQYQSALYFFFFPLCIAYGSIALLGAKLSIFLKFSLSIGFVGIFWFVLFYPFFANPRYLYSTEDIIHFRLIDEAIKRLGDEGVEQANVQAISNHVDLYVREGRTIPMRLEGRLKEKRIAELLPYLEGENYIPLIYKPLNIVRFYMSLLAIGMLFSFLAIYFWFDPPTPLYYEKVMLLMLPYAFFEVLHSYLFSMIASNDLLMATLELGQLFSGGVMMLLVTLFWQRLKFIKSVEGQFYETRLVRDSSKITRWRDHWDSWVLRHFAKANDISRRFLIRDDSVQVNRARELNGDQGLEGVDECK